MKTILLILLLTSLTFGQELLLLYDAAGYKNAETKVYLASLTTPLSKTYAATLDSFITKVKDSLAITSLSSKFDVMYDLGSETSEAGLKNLVKRSHDATAVNSPTFTQWQGFAGNGTTSYINTNYNVGTQGVNWATTSAGVFLYNRTNILTDSKALCANIQYTGTELRLEMTVRTTSMQGRLNATSAANNIGLSHNNDITGFHSFVRTGDDVTYTLRRATTVTQTKSQTSPALPGTVYLLSNRGISAFSTNQLSFFACGEYLTVAETGKLANCVEWLQDRKGTGVIP